MKNTFALALALGLTTGLAHQASFAAGLEQRGQPEAAPVALPTYGLDVPVRSALKTVIPAGWQLFVHQSAKLPASVSWKLGDVWPSVLGSMADAANLAVLVDWEQRTVLIRTEDVAAQEQTTRAEIYQAATTPLPRFDVPTALPAPVPSLPVLALADEARPAPAAPVVLAQAPPKRAALATVPPAELVERVASAQLAPLAPLAPLEVLRATSSPATNPVTAAGLDLPASGPPADTAAPAQGTVALKAQVPPYSSGPTPALGRAKEDAAVFGAVAAAANAELDRLPVNPVITSFAASDAPAEPARVTPKPQAPVVTALQAETARASEAPAAPAPRALSVLEAFSANASGVDVARPAPEVLTTSRPPQAPAEASQDGTAAIAAAKVLAGQKTAERKTELQAALRTAQEETAQLQAAQRIAQQEQAQRALQRQAADAYAAQQRLVTGAPNPYNDVMPGLPVTMQINGVPMSTSGGTPVLNPSPIAMAPLTAQVTQPAMQPVPATLLVSVAASPAPVLTAVPAVRINPAAELVAAQEVAASKKPAALKSTDQFTYVQASALNKAPVRRVAQGIAQRYGMRLVWEAPEVVLRGPVTLLAQSAEEDIYLLKKALGPSVALSFELQPGSRQLRVKSTDSGYRHVPVVEEPLLADAPVAAGPPLSPPMALSATPLGVASPLTLSAARPAFVLTIAANEPLENALVRLFKASGYTYEWKVSGGFEAARQMVFEGESLAKVLSQVLPPLGVSADVYTSDKHVVVRPGEARDK